MDHCTTVTRVKSVSSVSLIFWTVHVCQLNGNVKFYVWPTFLIKSASLFRTTAVSLSKKFLLRENKSHIVSTSCSLNKGTKQARYKNNKSCTGKLDFDVVAAFKRRLSDKGAYLRNRGGKAHNLGLNKRAESFSTLESVLVFKTPAVYWKEIFPLRGYLYSLCYWISANLQRLCSQETISGTKWGRN